MFAGHAQAYLCINNGTEGAYALALRAVHFQVSLSLLASVSVSVFFSVSVYVSVAVHVSVPVSVSVSLPPCLSLLPFPLPTSRSPSRALSHRRLVTSGPGRARLGMRLPRLYSG